MSQGGQTSAVHHKRENKTRAIHWRETSGLGFQSALAHNTRVITWEMLTSSTETREEEMRTRLGKKFSFYDITTGRGEGRNETTSIPASAHLRRRSFFFFYQEETKKNERTNELRVVSANNVSTHSALRSLLLSPLFFSSSARREYQMNVSATLEMPSRSIRLLKLKEKKRFGKRNK